MTLLVGHRGIPGLAPENTAPSLRLAQDAGAGAVEVDVRTSADGKPVLLHDRTFERLWGAQATPADLTMAEIAELRIPGHPEARVPTLEEAARAVDITLVVDGKDPQGVDAIIEDLDRAAACGRSVFIGELPVLTEVRKALPDATIILSWHEPTLPGPDVLETIRPSALNIPWALAGAEVVRVLGSAGHEVWTYCVDDAEGARHALDLGLDGLISNDVPAVIATLSQGTA